MSRIAALWSASAIAVLFALLVGAVLLRPVLSVDAGDQAPTGQTTLTTSDEDGFLPAYQDDDDRENDDRWDDDDHHDDEDHDEWEEHVDDD